MIAQALSTAWNGAQACKNMIMLVRLRLVEDKNQTFSNCASQLQGTSIMSKDVGPPPQQNASPTETFPEHSSESANGAPNGTFIAPNAESLTPAAKLALDQLWPSYNSSQWVAHRALVSRTVDGRVPSMDNPFWI
jgi:hypothetical protein